VVQEKDEHGHATGEIDLGKVLVGAIIVGLIVCFVVWIFNWACGHHY
jgi:hypothetical protein